MKGQDLPCYLNWKTGQDIQNNNFPTLDNRQQEIYSWEKENTHKTWCDCTSLLPRGSFQATAQEEGTWQSQLIVETELGVWGGQDGNNLWVRVPQRMELQGGQKGGRQGGSEGGSSNGSSWDFGPVLSVRGELSETRKNNHRKEVGGGFPGGAVVENLPANAGDMGSSPGLGRSHMPRSN